MSNICEELSESKEKRVKCWWMFKRGRRLSSDSILDRGWYPLCLRLHNLSTQKSALQQNGLSLMSDNL